MQTALLLLVALLSAAHALHMPVTMKPLVKPLPSPVLPQLFVYDHCPFCVRVRLAFGLKGIKHNVVFLANDDVQTPTALVGKKIAPIFEYAAADIKPMPESLDIIAKVDSDQTFGPTGVFRPMSGRDDLKKWMAMAKETNSLAQRPRYMMVPLPEFASRESREAFVTNHPIPPIEKAEWKEKLTSEQRWKAYVASYQESLGAIDTISSNLLTLDSIIHCADYCTEGGLSLDDIDLWSRLRSLTLVKGVKWPKKVLDYMTNLSVKSDVPLYFAMEC